MSIKRPSIPFKGYGNFINNVTNNTYSIAIYRLKMPSIFFVFFLLIKVIPISDPFLKNCLLVYIFVGKLMHKADVYYILNKMIYLLHNKKNAGYIVILVMFKAQLHYFNIR